LEIVVVDGIPNAQTKQIVQANGWKINLWKKRGLRTCL